MFSRLPDRKTISPKLPALVPVLFLLFITIYICFRNYTPGTYLSGWDTLQPEFNLSLYTQRVFFGAWQEHQGLGAPAAQAHLAELPRLPILWILTTFLPTNLVRYSFFFLTYILGGVGAYLFLSQYWLKKHPQLIRNSAAALGALFYVLNLGTLQQFYVPLEMFAVHFASLGFILLWMSEWVHSGKKKYLFWYFLAQVFSAPMAHTATLFYVVNVVIFLYAFFLCLFENKENLKHAIQRFVLLCIVTFFAHAYWLIPNLYYILFHSDYVRDARISRIFSQEAFWQNQAFGESKNVIILKNFLFNWKEFSYQDRKFIDLLDEWKTHLQIPVVSVILTLTSLVSVCSYVVNSARKSTHTKLPFLLFGLLPGFFLMNQNYPFTQIFLFLREHSSTFEEALRFPFTKFSILFAFFLSVGVGQSAASLFHLFQKLPKTLRFSFTTVSGGLIAASIIFANWPAIQGNLISPSMKVAIPDEYPRLFAWSKQQDPQQRIVKLPITTFWGWNYYDWNQNQPSYQGAGFLWFGLTQPLVDREFDRWALSNEHVYTELNYALQTQDPLLWDRVSEKYHLNLFLNDLSLFDPNRESVDYYQKLLSPMLKNTEKVFSAGSLSMYKNPKVASGFVYSWPTHLSDSSVKEVLYDPIFGQLGNYVQTQSEISSAAFYPLVHLLQENVPLGTVTTSPSQTTIEFKNLQAESLLLPKWSDIYSYIPIRLSVGKSGKDAVLTLASRYPKFSVNGQEQIYPEQSIQIPLNASIAEIKYVQIENQLVALDLNNAFELDLPYSKDVNIGLFSAKQFIEPILSTTEQKTTATLVATDEGLLQVKVANGTIIHQQYVRKNESVTLSLGNPQQFTLPSFAIYPIQQTINLTDEQKTKLSLPEVTVRVQPQAVNTFAFPVDSRSQKLLNITNPNFTNCQPGVGEATMSEKNSVYTVSASKGAIGCLWFDFPEVSKYREYILRAGSQNSSGMSAKVSIKQSSYVIDFLQDIITNVEKEKSFAIHKGRGTNGISVSLDSASFGTTPSINSVEKPSLIELPLSWLAEAHTPTESSALLPALSDVKSSRLNSGLYAVSAKNNQPEDAVLTLSQTYDTGWIGFATNKGNPLTLRILPHTLYNSWANGWFVGYGEWNIFLVYTPQLFAYIGMVILLFTTIVLVRKLRKKTRN